MLSDLSSILNKDVKYFWPGGDFESQEQISIFENITKHISALHHRNAQLRNAILASSEEKIRKRHEQFMAVLHSYVRLIVTDLHGPIAHARFLENSEKYAAIKNETFSGYEELIKLSNRSIKEMLDLGADFTRELFQFELRIKKYHQMEEQFIYPLYNEAISQA